MEEFKEIKGEEQEGEGYVPKYVCVKREVGEEEICESEISSCSDAKTTTGNILERMITDPRCRRPPCLGKWPAYPLYSESEIQENNHQFRAAQQPTSLSQMCSLRVTSEPNKHRQPAIIGTIGPACLSKASVLELIEAGMNVARINMSHADPCFTAEPFQMIIEANNQYKTIKDYDIPIGIMMELKGPDIRTGKIDPKKLSDKTRELQLKQGSTVRLTTDKIFSERCTEKMIYVDYECLPTQLKVGMLIKIPGGGIELRVDVIETTSVLCIVEKGGRLRNKQRLYIPNVPKPLPAMSQYDEECVELALKMDVDIIAVPKTRNEDVIQDLRKLLERLDENNAIAILAVISTFEGLENIDCILRYADGIIIQRNELSLEIGSQKMFIAQKEIIAKCNRVGKPVLCTAQLSSVETTDFVSERIEMNDIGSAIVDGADGIIIGRETALGDQGLQAVTQLSNILREAEAATMQKPFYFDLVDEQIPSVEPSKAVAMAAVEVANKIHAAAILSITTSGRTAQMLSWFRPRCPVIAISRVGSTARQMNLWRAIVPLQFSAPVLPDWFQDVKARFEYGISYGRDLEIIHPGDLLVLVSGFRKKSGFTNCIRIVFAAFEKDEFLDNVSEYYSSSKSLEK